MAILKNMDGELLSLRAHHLFGRSRSMTTTLSDPQLSAQHASVRWTGQSWWLEDLGSRNGTFLDGARLAVREQRPLAPGAVIGLGSHRPSFMVIDVGPPAPQAVAGETVLEGEAGFLALPEEESPEVVLFFDGDGGWTATKGERTWGVSSGDVVHAGDLTWTLHLPEALIETVEASKAVDGEVSLSFRVSADEEYVELDVAVGAQRHELASRAWLYLLMTLARARIADISAGDITPAEQGWVYTSDLAGMVGVTQSQLYVWLHRARKALGSLDGVDGDAVFERRQLTRQIRIGAAALSVSSL